MLGVLLPLLKVNQSTPRALVHGPLQYGAMDILNHSALHDQWGLHYFMQSLCWDIIIYNDLITTLDAYQLASSFVTQVMMIPEIGIEYLSFGWVPHLRKCLSVLDGTISIKKAWTPKLQ